MIAPGTRIGPYTVLGALGAGGMGEVYRARDERLSRDVALKVLPRALAADADRLAAFRREALALASLNHPNIATIHGFEEPGGQVLVLVLEHIEGETLAQRLARGPLRIEEALPICAQVAEALEVAHEAGVVHRDLKPGNVMIGPRGLVKVVDFGLAQRGAPSGEDAASGSPGYMSPEQLQGLEQDQRTDVFAFGCVLYECLSGTPAFRATGEAELHAAVLFAEPDRARLPERLPTRIRELVGQCLEKDPERRLRDMRAARLEIEEALGVRRAAALRAGEAIATPNNLPHPATRFVGREAEIESCAGMLSRTRLVTLTGVGGSGKTRLALQVAERRLPEHPDGVWFADLAPLQEPERVTEIMAVAIGLREEAGRTLTETLVEHLALRRVLLILDNCEHLVPACAALARLIHDRCPHVDVLATSREPLGVAGEQVVVVPSLSLPAGSAPTAEAAMGSEAVRLFVERAQLAQPGFALDDRGAPAVAEICRRLDGIPLAIELAAARVRVLGVNEIRAKLDDRFRLLTAGGATPVGRHQTLLAAIQWSYDHLGEPEARLFRGLAAFAGGWSLGTATAVCMESGDEFEVLDLLTQLVHKSLVVVERLRDGTSRYRMLETVREYARQRLDAAPEAARLRGRHLDYFLALAEAAERKLLGPEEARWLADLELELENLLVAFATSERVEGGGEIGLRLAGSIWRFWSTRGHFETGRRVLKEALRREGASAPTPWRAQALVRAGGLATYQGDYAAARPLVEEALAVYRRLSDEKGIARALSGLGTIALYQDDFESARAHNEEGLALYERLGQRRGVAVCLYNLGFVELCQDRLAEARAPLERSLELMREAGDRGTVAQALSVLGLLAARAGDAVRARAMLLEGLHGARELGAKAESVYLLEAAAELAWAIGELDRAAEWIGAAQAARRSLNIPMVPAEERQRQAFLARLAERRPGAGDPEFAAAPAEGLEDALTAAVSWLEGLTPAIRS